MIDPIGVNDMIRMRWKSATLAMTMVLDLAASVIDESAYAAFLRASTTPSTLSQTPPPGA